MDKYGKWLNAALRKLEEDFAKGVFVPQNESDIKCHLYHTLLGAKPQIEGLADRHVILSELPNPIRHERIDLALGSWNKRERHFEPRLLIEIKETSQAYLSAEEVKQRIENDVDKLRRYAKMLEKNKMTRILRLLKVPVVVFFFRGAGIHGIGTRTDRSLAVLQEGLDNIHLWWGPTG